eukprot:SAG11_NODE_35935_length_264_cov_0.830303_1_plen_87_part_11
MSILGRTRFVELLIERSLSFDRALFRSRVNTRHRRAMAQAFFGRGYEMLVEPKHCRIIGAKAWAHSSPPGSEDPWGHWSDAPPGSCG